MTKIDPDAPVLVFKEAKGLLRCSASTLLDCIHDGSVPAFKLGRGWRFYRAELMAFVDGELPDTEGQPEEVEVSPVEEDPPGRPGGIVYAVETSPGRVKLGYTTDLPGRLHAIEGHAGQAVLLRSEPGTVEIEKRLHAECKDHYIRREHFRNEGRVAEYVAGAFSAHDLPNEVSP